MQAAILASRQLSGNFDTMLKVFFLKDISMASLGENPPDTYLVYYDGYNYPKVPGLNYMPFTKFKSVYSTLHFNKLIFVGINRMITPANRCDMVNDFMQTMTRNITKVSIDTEPFIGEPWRVFYHYDVTNTGRFAVPHGYAIETEWKAWFYRDTNFCRLASGNIRGLISNTYSDLDPLKTRIEFEEENEKDSEWYDEIKKHTIDRFDTPKMMILTLLKECNKRYQIDFDFDFYRTGNKIILPDIGIYRFVAEENTRRMGVYNEIIKGAK
jgi:hypothetical protein